MLNGISKRIRQRKRDRKQFQEFLKNREHFEQFVEYMAFKTELPALHIVKQNTIHRYREAYGLTVLVETGTFLGDMVEAQRKYFAEVYSIELSADLHQQAAARFRDYGNVKLLQGDSGTVLKSLVAEIRKPALFWLDGHYSSGITAKGDKDTPVLEELGAILDAELHHGILIDDARLFTGEGDYPSIDRLAAFVTGKDPGRTVAVADDIIRIFRRQSALSGDNPL